MLRHFALHGHHHHYNILHIWESQGGVSLPNPYPRSKPPAASHSFTSSKVKPSIDSNMYNKIHEFIQETSYTTGTLNNCIIRTYINSVPWTNQSPTKTNCPRSTTYTYKTTVSARATSPTIPTSSVCSFIPSAASFRIWPLAYFLLSTPTIAHYCPLHAYPAIAIMIIATYFPWECGPSYSSMWSTDSAPILPFTCGCRAVGVLEDRLKLSIA